MEQWHERLWDGVRLAAAVVGGGLCITVVVGPNRSAPSAVSKAESMRSCEPNGRTPPVSTEP